MKRALSSKLGGQLFLGPLLVGIKSYFLSSPTLKERTYFSLSQNDRKDTSTFQVGLALVSIKADWLKVQNCRRRRMARGQGNEPTLRRKNEAKKQSLRFLS